LGIEEYSGTGTFTGGVFEYLATVNYWPGSGFGVTIFLYELGEDYNTDSISLYDVAYAGGATLSGGYIGDGAYGDTAIKDIGVGTFTAIR